VKDLMTQEKHHVRMLNPAEPKRGGRGRHLVKMINPAMRANLLKTGGAVEADKMFRNFRGKEAKAVTLVEARRGTPSYVAELGGLVELMLHDSDDYREPRARMKKVSALKFRVKEDEDGDKALKFNPARIKLVSDGNGDLHIVGFYKPLPEGLERGRSHFLGCVMCVVYEADKPHIETGEQHYEHFFCEYGGDFPRLFYKDGYLFFRGGTYSITKNGIEGQRHAHDEGGVVYGWLYVTALDYMGS
jgi:hypothetical protein